MFSQVDRAWSDRRAGLGIGLALVEGLVKMHGGTVTAESPGPGKGSTFTVTLPCDRPARAAAGCLRDPRLAAHNGGASWWSTTTSTRPTSMAMMLELLGNEVRTAHDGLAGRRAG